MSLNFQSAFALIAIALGAVSTIAIIGSFFSEDGLIMKPRTTPEKVEPGTFLIVLFAAIWMIYSGYQLL